MDSAEPYPKSEQCLKRIRRWELLFTIKHCQPRLSPLPTFGEVHALPLSHRQWREKNTNPNPQPEILVSINVVRKFWPLVLLRDKRQFAPQVFLVGNLGLFLSGFPDKTLCLDDFRAPSRNPTLTSAVED